MTDTPIKDALEEEKKKKENKTRSIKQQVFGKTKKNTKKQANAKNSKIKDDSSRDEETFCLLCVEPWSNSLPNEKWIQCTQCKLWAHEKCADADLFYVCQNCDSDGFE